jgi:hypothetical protein
MEALLLRKYERVEVVNSGLMLGDLSGYSTVNAKILKFSNYTFQS